MGSSKKNNDRTMFCIVSDRSILTGLKIAPMWHLGGDKIDSLDALDLLVAAAIGLLAACVGFAFTKFHWTVVSIFDRYELLDNQYAVKRALIGATAISILGMLIPHTMFWGESEFQQIATMAPASELEHVWPTRGLLGFEMDSALNAFIVGVSKIVAISFTVAGGYRGGFIFPLFTSGAAFGRVLASFFPWLNPKVACLCFASGLNVSITKTALGTTIILANISGEGGCEAVILTSALVALFATASMVR
jgi:H+/Cl- antiporter ClcA